MGCRTLGNGGSRPSIRHHDLASRIRLADRRRGVPVHEYLRRRGGGVWPLALCARRATGGKCAGVGVAASGWRCAPGGDRRATDAHPPVDAVHCLLIGAGLLLRTVRNLRYQDFGLDRHVLLVAVSPNQAGYSQPATTLLLRQARERLLGMPGVEAVGVSGAALLEGSNYWIDGSQELAA